MTGRSQHFVISPVGGRFCVGHAAERRRGPLGSGSRRYQRRLLFWRFQVKARAGCSRQAWAVGEGGAGERAGVVAVEAARRVEGTGISFAAPFGSAQRGDGRDGAVDFRRVIPAVELTDLRTLHPFRCLPSDRGGWRGTVAVAAALRGSPVNAATPRASPQQRSDTILRSISCQYLILHGRAGAKSFFIRSW